MTPTHKGLMYGIVPVYVDLSRWDEPEIAARGPVSDLALDLMEPLFAAFCWTVTLFKPDYEPEYPILLTGPVDY